MQKGKKHHGKSFEDFLTGSYLKELDPKTGVEPNAEIEKNEFLKFPDETVQKAIGDRHSSGGIEVNIPDGTEVVSNNLKFSKGQAKAFSEKFDTKVTTKDTYANGIEKALSKIGYRKIEKEEVELMKEIDKIKDSESMDSNTASMNLEFLTSKLTDVVRRKEELEPKKREIFDTAYQKQETKKQMEGGYENKEGFKYGGVSKQNLKKVASKYNLTEDQVQQLLNFRKGGKKLPKYEKGTPTEGEPTMVRSLDEVINQVKIDLASFDPAYEESQRYSKQSIERLNKVLEAHGKEPLPENATPTDINTAADKLQKYLRENKKEFVLDYMTRVAKPTKKLRGLLEKPGLTTEQLQEMYENKPDEVEDKILDGFNDGLWWYRMPYTKTLEVTEDQKVAIEEDETVAPNIREVGGKKYIVKPTGEYLELIPKKAATEEAEEDVTDEGEVKLDTEVEEMVFKDLPRKKAPGFQRFIHPEQYVGYPSRLDPLMVETPRRGRVGYSAISPVQQLENIAATNRATQDMLQDLPQTQRAAALVASQANALAQSDKAISDVNRMNMENRTRADLFNIQQGDAENLGEINAKNRYQELMGRAKATREANMHRAFNRASDIHAQNFYRDVDLNRYAAMTDNYELDPYGARPVFMAPQANPLEDRMRYLELKRAQGVDVASADKKEDKKKKTV